MAVHLVETGEETFDGELGAAGNQLVVVEFWGPDCPHCQAFHRQRAGLLAELGRAPLRFLTVDAFRQEGLARRFGLSGIPTFLLFRGTRLLGRMSEYRGRALFLAAVRDHLS